MICKDCIHYDVCSQFSKFDGANHEYYTYANKAEKCGAETRTFVPNAEYAVKDKAIEAWNRRTDTNGRNEKDV